RIYLRNFFKAHNVRVVLAEYGSTGVGVLGMCKDLRIPLVVHFHGSDAYSTENLDRHRESYGQLFGYASAIRGVSTYIAEQLVRLGATKEKVFYNPCGVEVSNFHHIPSLVSPLQIVAVGRFVEKKAPYLTILAFKKVLERLPNARLAMVGGGP